MRKKSLYKNSSMPSMEVNGAVITLPLIEEAEILACQSTKSDEELARDYALMMEDIYMDAQELDLINNAPDRRFYKRNREAWVYEHGNVSELVFIR